MHGLLDRATQLTNVKRQTPRPEPLTREAALKTTALAATLLLTSIVTNGATAFLIIMAMTFGVILPRMLFERAMPCPA
jgi:hypothetical protein